MKNLSLTFCLVIAALFGNVDKGFARMRNYLRFLILLFSMIISSTLQVTAQVMVCSQRDVGIAMGSFQNPSAATWVFPKQITLNTQNLNHLNRWQKRLSGGQQLYNFDPFSRRLKVRYQWNNGISTPDIIYKKCILKQTVSTAKKNNGTQITKTQVVKNAQYRMKEAFKKLSFPKRKLIQINLKEIGLYKSSVDGLYGRGTSDALTAYNKQNLNGADLKKSDNVEKLIKTVLGLKPSPRVVPVPVAKTPVQEDDTYKVASGTGFYVSDEGHIITNHHVIEGCKDMKVHSKGNVLETKKIAQDTRNDLALLKISEIPQHSFALSTESPFPLQGIVAAGFPFGEKVSSTLKFTEGIISSIAGLGDDYSQIQIDAAIQPGNSGGPILDEYGNVVAVAVAKLSLKKIFKDYGVVPENTNFGVKASAVKNLMEGNSVPFKSPNTEVISKRELSQIATDGTVYLTCWMTTAQIEQMRAKKVLFEDLE